jgi:sporulation protein YlmC with PRC-barrel domain
MQAAAKSARPLIASDRVEGTAVYDEAGNHLGKIRRLMIGKESGQVAYAVVVFERFFGTREDSHLVPWAKLKYDTALRGYRTDLTEVELRSAPAHARGEGIEDPDPEHEDELHAYFRIPPDWRAM